jgi:integrase
MNPRTGNALKIGDRWYGRASWTETKPDGTKVRRFRKRAATPNTKGAALEEAKRLVAEVDRDIDHAASGTPRTIHALLSYFKARYVHPPEYHQGKRVSGYASHEAFSSHISTLLRLIPDKPLALFGAEDCRQAKLIIVRDKSKKGKGKGKPRPRSTANVHRIIAVLRRVLAKAEELQLITRNPFPKGLIRPANENHRTRILSSSEEARLLSFCVDERAHLRPIVIALLDTGMRHGELKNRKRRDFDFDAQEIRVYATKTEEPRVVPMSDRLRDEMQAWGDDDLHDDFHPFQIRITRAWAHVKSSAKISDLRIHDLRHTAATRMIEGGMELAEVARILGHRDIRTTYRYVNMHAGTVSKAKAIINAANEDRESLSVN